MDCRELYDGAGNHKYLTADERKAFLKTAERAPREVRTFCAVLHYTGCRISEALALTGDRVDFTNGVITFESLKKRRPGVYRSVPPTLPDALDLVHDIRATEARRGRGRKVPVWPQAPPKGHRLPRRVRIVQRRLRCDGGRRHGGDKARHRTRWG